MQQLERIAPDVIVTLGKFAAQTLLRSKTPITQLRGRWFDYRGVMLMPTFHPAYLLRNPADKRLVWEDVQKVMRVLGLPVGRIAPEEADDIIAAGKADFVAIDEGEPAQM